MRKERERKRKVKKERKTKERKKTRGEKRKQRKKDKNEKRWNKKCTFPFAERNCGYEEECVAKRGAAGYLIERQMKIK